MAAELQVSRESVRRRVKRDLGFSPLKLSYISSLTTASRQKQFEKSRLLIHQFAAHGLNSVLFTDEKIFTGEQAFNHQNDKILTRIVFHQKCSPHSKSSICRGLGRSVKKRENSLGFCVPGCHN